MDNRPLAVFSNIDADRFHGTSAATGAVAGLLIDVSGPQAVGAVVAVSCAEGPAVGVHTAAYTAEGFGVLFTSSRHKHSGPFGQSAQRSRTGLADVYLGLMNNGSRGVIT